MIDEGLVTLEQVRIIAYRQNGSSGKRKARARTADMGRPSLASLSTPLFGYLSFPVDECARHDVM